MNDDSFKTMPTWQGEAITEDEQLIAIEQMVGILDELKANVAKGHVASMVIAIVQQDMLTSHAYVCHPVTAVLAIGAVEVAKVAIATGSSPPGLNWEKRVAPKSSPPPAEQPAAEPPAASAG